MASKDIDGIKEERGAVLSHHVTVAELIDNLSRLSQEDRHSSPTRGHQQGGCHAVQTQRQENKHKYGDKDKGKGKDKGKDRHSSPTL